MNTKIALHINEIIKETPDAISICFAQPEQAFSYRSGQFLTLACTITEKKRDVVIPYLLRLMLITIYPLRLKELKVVKCLII